MTATARLSRSCTPLIVVTALGALLALALPVPRPTPAAIGWAPSLPNEVVESELRSGCQQLVGLIEADSPHAEWAVARLRAAVAAPSLGPAVHALAHRGLAIAYRTGRGIAADPAAAAMHAARGGVDPSGADARMAKR